MSFDIGKCDVLTKSEAGAEMTLISPKTGQPVLDANKKPVTITLRGRTAQAYKAAQRAMNVKRIEMQGRGVTPTEQDLQADNAELLAICTVGWSFTEMDGAPFPPTPENIRAFWTSERFPWIAEQATRFVMSDGNFLAT